MPIRTVFTAMIFVASMLSPSAAQESVKLFAAGSLKAALSDVAAAFSARTGSRIETNFGPSGLLREKIEGGEKADLFASANMKHPQTLEKAGYGGPVRLFARNRLCAIAQAGLDVTTDNLLDAMLRPELKLGTSTPKADPSGDYAFALFGKAEAFRPGAKAALEGKSLQLTGGPNSERPPAGRNNYGWVMETGKADIFLTYCTNAVLAKREVPGLQIVAIPEALAVGADYGLIVASAASQPARALADFILSEEGQGILKSYGFTGAN